MDKSKNVCLKTRENGILLYLLIHWILLTAIPVAIFLSVLRGLVFMGGIKFLITADYFNNLLLTMLLTIIISIVLGIRKWIRNEKIIKTLE